MGTAEVHAELDRLASAELSGDAAVLGAEVLELHRVAERAVAEASRRLAEYDRLKGYLDQGQTSSKAWLRTETTMSHGQAAAAEHVAGIHGRLPRLFTAWHAGETTFEHLRHVEINLRKLPDELWPEVDAELTEKARTLTAKDFGAWLRELAQSLGGEPKPKDETQHEARRLSLSPGFNGMTTVSGRLTPEVAEKLTAALSAASRPDAAGEVRLPNQRKADALESLVDTALNAGTLPVDGGERPHLNLDVDLDQIDEQAQRDEEQRQAGASADWHELSDEQRAARIADALSDAAAATDPASGRPRYHWTGPASVSAARRLACGAILLPIFTRGGTPLDVGQQTRVVGTPLRRFILARDSHCRWPGCTMPGRWTEVHHVVHWKDGGVTDRWNLLLLCSHHHKAAHGGRFTIVLHAPGHITVRRRLNPDDPYYEIRLKAPPPGSGFSIDAELREQARRVAGQR